MLTTVIGDLLPSALGVALSPVPIIAVLLVLGSPRARAQGTAFALGWILGLVVVSVVVVLVSGAREPPDEPSALLGWIKITFGGLFLFLATKQWRSRPAPGEEPETPAWMDAMDTMATPRTSLVGAALSGLNPKNLALTLAATATIGQTALSGPATAVSIGVFVFVGSLTVAGPVVVYLVVPDRSATPLASIKEFMSAHNAAIMMIVLLLLGARLLGKGLAAV